MRRNEKKREEKGRNGGKRKKLEETGRNEGNGKKLEETLKEGK